MAGVTEIITGILLEGLRLFSSPFFHPELLWIVIPVIISWVFAEYFQEKMGTDIGNAISNGIVAIWSGIDWTRNLLGSFKGFSMDFIIKEGLCIMIFLYGLTVIVLGIRNNKIIRLVGRVREVTYFILAFTPILYGYFTINVNTIIAILVYFPIFYIIVEIIDRLTPSPEWEKNEEGNELGLPKTEEEQKMKTGLEETAFGQIPMQQQVSQPVLPTCPYCEQNLTYIPQYNRYYCYNCKRYV